MKSSKVGLNWLCHSLCFGTIISLLLTACPPPPPLPPAEVSALTASPGDSMIQLTWTDPADEGFSHIELKNPRGMIITLDKGQQSYSEAGLVNSTAYTYTVKTVGIDGLESAGLQVSATPMAASYSQTISGKALMNTIPLRGVKVTLLTDSGPVYNYSDAEGNYSFTVTASGEYTLSPGKTGFTFSPPVYFVNMDKTNITSRDFFGSAATNYITDPWGNVWDAIPRSAKSYIVARDDCADEEGRLPTPTELYRNSQIDEGTGLLRGWGDLYELWTNIEYDINRQVTVSTSTGGVSSGIKTDAYYYRCFWPNVVSPENSPSFTGGNINTLATEQVPFELTINGVVYVMDTVDRAPLTWNSAVRECEFYGGFLPSESFYTVAIQQGLPNGTGAWNLSGTYEGLLVPTSYYAVFGVIRWNGSTNPNFNPQLDVTTTWTGETNPQRFRCASTKLSYDLSPVSSLGSGRADFPKFGLTTTVASEASASHVLASDAAFEAGGHLPNLIDYHRMISSGLPGTSSIIWNWTGDYVQNDNQANFIGVVQWDTSALSFTGRYNGASVVASTDAGRQFRVVYYPLNQAYQGPTEADCHGGRFEFSIDLGSGKQLKVWADNQDRPAATLGSALKTCYEKGGHLATKRDFIELIRHGLPNGSNGWLWTSDPSTNSYQNLVRWSGEGTKTGATAFNNVWDVSSAHNIKTASYPYRCVWTNEVRVK